MKENELINKIAALESKVDHLESELSYLDNMLVSCGFTNGIQTLKETVQEILSENNQDIPPPKNPNSIDLL
jgi:hypothetical protein